MKITTLALMFVALTAVKVSANGCWDCEPPAPKPVPDTKPSVTITPDGGVAHDPYARIYYAICTCDKMRVAWGFESLELRTNKARSQCEIRRERINCPMKWK